MRSQVGKMAPWLITVWSPIETRCCYDFNFVTSPACDWVIDCAVWTGLSKWFDNTQQAVTENLRVLDWKTRQLLENLRLPHVLEKGNCMLILYPGPILNYTLYFKEEFFKKSLKQKGSEHVCERNLLISDYTSVSASRQLNFKIFFLPWHPIWLPHRWITLSVVDL